MHQSMLFHHNSLFNQVFLRDVEPLILGHFHWWFACSRCHPWFVYCCPTQHPLSNLEQSFKSSDILRRNPNWSLCTFARGSCDHSREDFWTYSRMRRLSGQRIQKWVHFHVKLLFFTLLKKSILSKTGENCTFLVWRKNLTMQYGDQYITEFLVSLIFFKISLHFCVQNKFKSIFLHF